MKKVIQIINKLTPLAVLGCLAYFLYAYCFKYAWQYVGDHHRGAGIVFIVLFVVLLALSLISWAQVLILGPGQCYKDPNKVGNVETASSISADKLPETFLCDPQGFRQWCSTCQATKPDRAHHSSQTGHCVPKMDHFCAWLAATIGQRNLKMFVLTVFYYWLLCVFTIVSTIIYAHHPFPHTSALYVVMYILAGFWTLFLAGVLGFHIKFILGDVTTLENMSRRELYLPIYNIELHGQRIVSRLQPQDLKGLHGPYSSGSPWTNWTNVMGPTPFHWFIPIALYGTNHKQTQPILGPDLVAVLQKRFEDGQEGYLAQVQPVSTNH